MLHNTISNEGFYVSKRITEKVDSGLEKQWQWVKVVEKLSVTRVRMAVNSYASRGFFLLSINNNHSVVYQELKWRVCGICQRSVGICLVQSNSK